ncbi:MAG: hypothetical protein KBF41_10425, partial [Azonexus sp.]|nr:hypothetical protein [Azonexus sp.]
MPYKRLARKGHVTVISCRFVENGKSDDAGTLERWRDDAQSMPARGRAWTVAARLEAVIVTAALDETSKSA